MARVPQQVESEVPQPVSPKQNEHRVDIRFVPGHAAREQQSHIEGRIKELEGVISLSDVINVTKLSGSIKFGATIEVYDEDTEEEKTYQIVGEPEADITQNLLNIKSPIARALIGKEVGDSVEVRTPGGIKSYEVISIKFI